MTFLLGILIPVSQAQPASMGDENRAKSAFEVNMFLGAPEKINLMLAVRQPKRVIIRLKNAKHTVLYEESLSKIPASHWRKFDFEGMKTGTYYFEISTGDQKLIRQIEVGILPAVQSQRFISYVQ